MSSFLGDLTWPEAFPAFPGTEVADPSVFEVYVLDVARSLRNFSEAKIATFP